jgi:hypothetical protein
MLGSAADTRVPCEGARYASPIGPPFRCGAIVRLDPDQRSRTRQAGELPWCYVRQNVSTRQPLAATPTIDPERLPPQTRGPVALSAAGLRSCFTYWHHAANWLDRHLQRGL